MPDKLFIQQLESKYPDYLRMIVRNEGFEKIRLRGSLKAPGSRDALYDSIKAFQRYEKKDGRPGWEIEWSNRKFPGLGKQRWPKSIHVTTEEDFVFLLGKQAEIAVFRSQLKELISWNYQIIGLLTDHPLKVLKHGPDWKGICAVADMLLQEDVSGYYARNLPVPVHSKFIGQHESTILSLLKCLNPDRFPEQLNDLETAAGLRKKPHLYPMHWLDQDLAARYTAGFDILSLPFMTLRDAAWNIPEIWIVENETNLYLLESRKNALAVFAKGYALHNLKQIPFFHQATRLYYWGDLDEDGYYMLEQFRGHYRHTISLFMDEETVSCHQDQIQKIKYRYRRKDLDKAPL